MKIKKKVNKKESKFIKEFIAFGNKRKVFWSITLAAIIITVIGLTLTPESRSIIKYIKIIGVIEVIYIWIYIKSKH